MKKIKIFYLLVLLFGASNTMTITFYSINKQKPEWKQFFQQYVTSIGIGAAVGVSIDVLTEYFFGKMAKTIERELLILVIRVCAKSKLLLEIKKDMQKYAIPYKESLMHWTAQLTPFRSILKEIYVHIQGGYA